MKEFEYAELQEINFEYCWYFNGEKVKEIEYKDFISTLNYFGKRGWQVVSVSKSNKGAILIREVINIIP